MNIREQQKQEKLRRRRRKKLIKVGIIAAILIAIVLVAVGFFLRNATPDEIDFTTTETEAVTENPDSVNAKQSLSAAALNLEEQIFADGKVEASLKKNLGEGQRYVFLSISDGNSAAKVFHTSGTDARNAYDKAIETALDYVYSNGLAAKYVRVDFVNNIKEVKAEEFPDKVTEQSEWYGEYYRHGVAFDENFETAVTDAELNANDIIDYDGDKNIKLVYLNKYLLMNGDEEIDALPAVYRVFTLTGYFYDGTNTVRLLSRNSSTSYGRRSVKMNSEVADSMAGTVFDYLLNGMNEDGSFYYGIYPADNTKIESYDIAKHAGTLVSIIRYADKFDGAGLNNDKIRSAIDFLSDCVVNKDTVTSFAADTGAHEISIAATAKAVEAFVAYAQRTGDKSFDAKIINLTNGLLSALNSSAGICDQCYYYESAEGESFTVKETSHLTAIDDIVLKALCKVYEYNNDQIILDAAKLLADKLVSEEYEQYGEPEFSAAFNELTKYSDNEKYYTAALKNIYQNLETIENRIPVYANYTKALLDTYEIYLRIDEKSVSVSYLDEFDMSAFINTLSKRIAKLPDGYAYPETAMFMDIPDSIIGSYMSRNDAYRIRIDDCAKFIDALLSYSANYTNIGADLIVAEAEENESENETVTETVTQ